MFAAVLSVIDRATRRVFWALSAVCLAMLGFGVYLQLHNHIEPCPMCIVQRDALIVIAVLALLTATSGKKSMHIFGSILLLLGSVFGAFVAARQSWLQWYPPETATCGRDFYGMIENFPLSRAIPMIFRGTGDCAVVDWTFLGGSIANWSFVCFSLFAALSVLILWRKSSRS